MSRRSRDQHRDHEPFLALTQGDPAGIGPEIALKAWLAVRDGKAASAPFAIVSDSESLRARAAALGLDLLIESAEPAGVAAAFGRALPVIETGHGFGPAPGKPSVLNAKGVLASIEQAVSLTRSGLASAIVTNPIAKHILYEAGFRHPGHTEYLGVLAQDLWGIEVHPVMLIWSETLAVVPVTIHIPLKEVPSALSCDLVVETGRIVASDMRRRFGIARPRLAFCGLNPHAGEGGALGQEDDAIIRPAVARLKREKIDASGPYPADTMFHARAREKYDVALGMYHDQVLVPAKTLAFDDGVNVTLGLPFIRTSPDHGTAFDIAAKGVARPDSLIAALKLATRLAKAEATSKDSGTS